MKKEYDFSKGKRGAVVPQKVKTRATNTVDKQQQYERDLVKGFLEKLELESKDIASYQHDGKSRPDVKAKIKEGNNFKLIGVEHIDYHLDSLPGNESQGRAIVDFWDSVNNHIIELTKDIKDCEHFTGHVSFKRNFFNDHLRGIAIDTRKNKAKQLAEELILLCKQITQSKIIQKETKLWNTDIDPSYELIKNVAHSITIWPSRNRYLKWGNTDLM